MDYKKAIEFIRERRKDDLFNAEQLYSSALQNSKVLYGAESALRAEIIKQVKSGKTDTAAITLLEGKRDAVLNKMGLDDKALNPPPRCAFCGDTGLCGKDICACVKSLVIQSGDNIKIPLKHFEKADFDLYDETQRERNKKIFAAVKDITEIFPKNQKRNILIMGPTGTGKTFLAGCCASSALDRMKSVTALTAFDFTNRALKYHTTFDDQKSAHIQPLLDSDLLIIDDLGSEVILKNITIEYLYLILNERMQSDKLTFITSNLSPDGILTRYGERIYSRLFDKALSFCNILNNSDLRTKKAQ